MHRGDRGDVTVYRLLKWPMRVLQSTPSGPGSCQRWLWPRTRAVSWVSPRTRASPATVARTRSDHQSGEGADPIPRRTSTSSGDGSELLVLGLEPLSSPHFLLTCSPLLFK